MPRQSSIKTLPEDLLAELDRLILDGRLTCDQLRDFLASRVGEHAASSRSAVGRHAREIKETAAMLRESREIARGIAQEIGPGSVEGEQGRLLVEMLRTFFFRFVRERTGDPESVFDSGEFAKMARALRDMSQAMRLEQDFARRIREEARKEALEEVRGRVRALGGARELKGLTEEELDRAIAALAVG